jgi:ABC-type sugar transport system ATPase subunit
MRTKAREILDTLGATDIDPGTVVGDLNIANQQLVEISKALTRQARVVILDEPSAVLGSQELDLLYAMVRRLTAGGIAVVYITHRLDEVQEIADVVTVMRDGRKVLDEARSEVSKTEMISAMVGREVLLDAPPKWQVGVSRAQDGPTLSVQNVVLPGMAGEALNFEVQSGEIVGIAGLTGSGRSRILRLLAGLEPPSSGKVNLGQTVLNLRTPRSAIAQGIVLVPEDRKRLGLILNQSVISNTVLSILSRISRLGFISRSSSRGRTQEMVDRLSIKIASMNQEVRYLSGGNQQKVVIARCIGTNPKLLLLDEPLRGVDIGAKSEIVDIVGQIAEQGTAVIVVSSEIEDVLALTDRILVVRDGCIVRELIGDEATETMVLQYSSVRQS